MGSGSSRSGRVLKRRRSPESRSAGPCTTAPEGAMGPRVSATAVAPTQARGAAGAATEEVPAAPPDGRDETLRLLDQLLAESAAWDQGKPAQCAPVRPRPRPAAGAESAESPEQSAGGHTGNSSVSKAPSSSHKRPERQSPISYDYSEEELMASIEREYCR
ncbi:cystin-1 [Nycticebus coucang]|uniref:cystin-1 n=1 Tax=Nycticebus coucang TaxID=9470 RepID=UPI00234D4228|nr:cystin-1 [Nycticebus coucang]